MSRPAWLTRWMVISLCLWGAGVESTEGLALVGVLGCAIAVGIDLRRERVDLRAAARAGWPILAFIGWGLLGPTLLGHPPSGTGASRALDWLALPIGAWAFVAVGPRGRRIVAITVAAVFLASCLCAGLQSFGLWPSLKAFAPLRFTKIPFYRVYEPVTGAHGRFMGGGLMFHRLKFAHVGALTVVAALALGLGYRGKVRRVAFTVVGVGAMSILLFPFARAAVVALAFAAAGVVVLSARRRGLALLGAAGLLVVLAGACLAVKPLRARFATSLTERGNGYRDELLEAGLNAVRAAPIAGVGLGRFSPKRFAPPGASVHVLELNAKAHDQFVTLAAESGLVGLALFLTMLVWLVRRMRSVSPESVAGLGGLAFFLMISFVHDPLFHPEFSLGLVLLCSLALAVRDRVGVRVTDASAGPPTAGDAATSAELAGRPPA